MRSHDSNVWFKKPGGDCGVVGYKGNASVSVWFDRGDVRRARGRKIRKGHGECGSTRVGTVPEGLGSSVPWRFQAVLCNLACGRLSEGKLRSGSLVSRYLSKLGQAVSGDPTRWNGEERVARHSWGSVVLEAPEGSEGEPGCCAGR